MSDEIEKGFQGREHGGSCPLSGEEEVEQIEILQYVRPVVQESLDKSQRGSKQQQSCRLIAPRQALAGLLLLGDCASSWQMVQGSGYHAWMKEGREGKQTENRFLL